MMKRTVAGNKTGVVDNHSLHNVWQHSHPIYRSLNFIPLEQGSIEGSLSAEICVSEINFRSGVENGLRVILCKAIA